MADIRKFKKLKSEVQYCLNRWKITRNSDIQLMIKVWLSFYDKKCYLAEQSGVSFDDLSMLPQIDVISRARRKFNHKGEYLPTMKKIAEQRRINAKIWQKYMAKHK